MAVAADGRFLYISETVSIYLGLSQVSVASPQRDVDEADETERNTSARRLGVRVGDEKRDNDNEKAKANKKQRRGRADATCNFGRKARDSAKVQRRMGEGKVDGREGG